NRADRSEVFQRAGPLGRGESATSRRRGHRRPKRFESIRPTTGLGTAKIADSQCASVLRLGAIPDGNAQDPTRLRYVAASQALRKGREELCTLGGSDE